MDPLNNFEQYKDIIGSNFYSDDFDYMKIEKEEDVDSQKCKSMEDAFFDEIDDSSDFFA